MERLRQKRIVSCATWLGFLILAGSMSPALAETDAPDPYTSVAEWTIARDQWQGYSDWAMRNHKPILERLAADGTLIDWGFFETYIHTESGSTHGVWWSSASFAGIEKTRAELLKAPSHPAAAAGAHHDYLFRSRMGASRSGAISGGFLSVNVQELRPGQGKDWSALWERTSKPVLDDLLAQGTIASYAVQAEDSHTQSSALRWLVTISPSAAAEDQVEAAFDAAISQRSEAEREAFGRLMRDLTVPESHRDYLARITAAWFK